MIHDSVSVLTSEDVNKQVWHSIRNFTKTYSFKKHFFNMSRLLLLCAFLLNGNDATIIPNLLNGMRLPISSTSSQFHHQPVISVVSCNNSENANPLLPRPQYQISHPYFTPTILNYAPTRFGGSSGSNEENQMDIGNRIQAPLSNFIKSWIPTRLSIPSRPATTTPLQNNFLEEMVEKTMDVEKAAKFYLFTRKNPGSAQELQLHQKGSVNESNFSPDLETKLIFHGFTEIDAPGEWVNVMKETYLSVSDVNLIVADFSSFPLHNLIRSSLPIFAARRVTEFITFLSEEAGADLNSFHLIARSYGCHIVGLSGRQLGGKLGRITALEPASKIAIVSGNGGLSSSLDFRLSKDNAAFVDVIHVNGQRFFFHGPQFGLVNPMGHVDVYPNVAERGLGCPGENMNSRRYSLRFCHLGRGVRTFTKSIKYPEMYPMCRCSSFESYKSGHCSCFQRETMTFLGEISNTTNGVYQLAPISQQNPSFSYFPNTLFG